MPRTLLFALLLAVLLGACTAPPAVPTPTAAVESQPAATDILPADPLVTVRPVAAAILYGTPSERAAFVSYTTLPCTQQEGLGGPPKCAASQPEGSPVTVLPLLGSEGSFAGPAEIEAVMTFEVLQLAAIYKSPPMNDPNYPTGDTVVLVSRQAGAMSFPQRIYTRDGLIVRMDTVLGPSLEDVLSELDPAGILLSPQEAADWAASLAPAP